MADAGASVLAKLKNKAAESGRSCQLCMQLFCQEEFLRRVAKSKYSDNLVLKGGLFLYSLTNFDSRVTVDVEKKYSGIGALLVAHIKNTRTPFGIDFGVGDVIVPHQEKRNIPTQLPDFESPEVNTYSIETTVAEKLDAILNLMEFSSRMKDYYDLCYLANKFDFDGTVLTEALRKTFENRNRQFTVEQFEQIMTFDVDDGMQKKWTQICTCSQVTASRDINQLIKAGVLEKEAAGGRSTSYGT
jgi:predicted nucleotidyltransferase component of viral defense system